MRDRVGREVALVAVGEVLKADYFGGKQGERIVKSSFPLQGAGGDFLPPVSGKAPRSACPVSFAQIVWFCPSFNGTPVKISWLGFA